MTRSSFAARPLARQKRVSYNAWLRRGVAQPGRALSSGGRGRRFKSSHPDQFFKGDVKSPRGASRAGFFMPSPLPQPREWPTVRDLPNSPDSPDQPPVGAALWPRLPKLATRGSLLPHHAKPTPCGSGPPAVITQPRFATRGSLLPHHAKPTPCGSGPPAAITQARCNILLSRPEGRSYRITPNQPPVGAALRPRLPNPDSRPEGRLYGPLPFCKPPVFHRDLTACLYSALSRGFPAPQPRCNSLHRSNSPTRLWLSLATLLLVRCRSNRWFIGVLAIKKWFPPRFRLLIHVTIYASARTAIRPPAEE